MSNNPYELSNESSVLNEQAEFGVKIQRIKKFNPVQTAKIVAVLYLVVSVVIFLPVMLIAASLSPSAGSAGMSVAVILFMPLMYALGGFIMTLISCWLYNLVSSKVGGIEVELEAA